MCRYGKDINGKTLPEDETEYVDGMLKAGALATKNKKDFKLHQKKVALDDKKKRREERKKEAEPTLSLDDMSVGDEVGVETPLPTENLLGNTGGCGSLLPSAAADVCSSDDDVIAS